MGTQWTNDLRTVCPNSGGFGEEFYSNPHGSDGKEFACNDGDPGSIPGLGRSPGVENGNPLQYSCLENSMERWAIVHGDTKSQT